MLGPILELTSLGDQRFCAEHHQANFRHSLFGGQVLAQALMAGGLCVEENRLPHSLHAYFLKAGHTQSPIYFDVKNLLEGKSVSNRHVEVSQDDKLIFSALISFHKPEPGYQHQMDPPSHPSPKELHNKHGKKVDKTIQRIAEFIGSPAIEVLPTDISKVDTNLKTAVHPGAFWFRGSEVVSQATKLQHYAALAFVSDIGLLSSALTPHNISLFDGTVFPASMDHSIWFHREPQFNDWHLYETVSPWAGRARGLCQGTIYNEQFQRVATVAQEGLIRPRDPSAIA